MADLTFTAVVDESRLLRLPPDAPLGEVEVVVRERVRSGVTVGNGRAILESLQNAPPAGDAAFWQRARAELLRSRDEWDEE